MSETVKHTPTPWTHEEVRTASGRAFRIGAGDILKPTGGACIIYDDYPSGPNERSANAALIVRAVNSHAAMVEALEMFLELVADTSRFASIMNLEDYGLFNRTQIRARAALSLAKGEAKETGE